LEFTAFAPSGARVVVLDCPGVNVSGSDISGIRGTQGRPDANGIGGNAGPALGIWVDGCADAELRGNIVHALRPGAGSPGGRGLRGGRGGGLEGIRVVDSPGALLALNEVYDLAAGTSGRSGVSELPFPPPPPGRVLGVRVVDSDAVTVEGLVVHDLHAGGHVLGVSIEGGSVTASRVLAYRLQGAEVSEGMRVAEAGRLDLRASTLAHVPSPAGRGAGLAALRAGRFQATWSIFHALPRLYAAAGDVPGTGTVTDSLISAPVDGHVEAENVALQGEIRRGDPMFANAAAGDFRLQPESPAVDAGPAGGEACAAEPGGADGCVLDWGYYGGTASGSAAPAVAPE